MALKINFIKSLHFKKILRNFVRFLETRKKLEKSNIISTKKLKLWQVSKELFLLILNVVRVAACAS